MLSYFNSSLIKVLNPDWRSGQALVDVFRFSAYPASQSMRRLADHPKLLFVGSWAVMAFEVLFPLALIHPIALYVALGFAACFHLVNAILFGLNRFLWTWIAAYPSIIWFQHRFIGSDAMAAIPLS
jgi:hypothetical protein